jgi:hypothetical protein
MISQKIEIPEPYRKVRKTYTFLAVFLLFWEFLGIQINSISSNNVSLEIQTPEAIPSILFLMVIYFGYRLYSEWHYFNYYNLQSKLPVLDYYLSQLLGILSVTVYFTQNTLKFQIIEQFTLDIATTFALTVIGIILLIALYTSFVNLKKVKFRLKNLGKQQKLIIYLPIILTSLFFLSIYIFGVFYSVTTVFSMLLLASLLHVLYRLSRSYFGESFFS